MDSYYDAHSHGREGWMLLQHCYVFDNNSQPMATLKSMAPNADGWPVATMIPFFSSSCITLFLASPIAYKENHAVSFEVHSNLCQKGGWLFLLLMVFASLAACGWWSCKREEGGDCA
jgi:hypothetical protein